MLQKNKHIHSLVLAILFLYPLVYQSIHAFEHTHGLQDSVCCGHCSHSSPGSAPQEDEPAASEALSAKQDECGVCNFHYAKLQINSSLNVYLTEQAYYLFPDPSYPKPFVLYQGYIRSLRAPPAC